MQASLYQLLSQADFSKLNSFQQRVYLGLLVSEALELITQIERFARESNAIVGTK